METSEVIDALAALAQSSRLAIYRLLVEQGPAGLPAGAIAEKLDLPAATLSFHLAHLARAAELGRREHLDLHGALGARLHQLRRLEQPAVLGGGRRILRRELSDELRGARRQRGEQEYQQQRLYEWRHAASLDERSRLAQRRRKKR